VSERHVVRLIQWGSVCPENYTKLSFIKIVYNQFLFCLICNLSFMRLIYVFILIHTLQYSPRPYLMFNVAGQTNCVFGSSWSLLWSPFFTTTTLTMYIQSAISIISYVFTNKKGCNVCFCQTHQDTHASSYNSYDIIYFKCTQCGSAYYVHKLAILKWMRMVMLMSCWVSCCY
jgi:hypothetical protein